MEMLIIVLVVAAIAAYLLWGRRGGSDEALMAAAATPATGGPLASIEAYRQSSPSNFYLGKPTCNRCGSTLVDTGGSVTSCRNCGTGLYRN